MGPSPSFLQAPTPARHPPHSISLPAVFWGSRKVHKSCPCQTTHPFPQSPRQPSAQPCMWLCCSLLAPSESSYSLQCPRGKLQWEGVLLGEAKSSSSGRTAGKASPGLLVQGQVLEALSLKAQSSVQQDAPSPPNLWLPEGNSGHLAVFIRAGGQSACSWCWDAKH